MTMETLFGKVDGEDMLKTVQNAEPVEDVMNVVVEKP